MPSDAEGWFKFCVRVEAFDCGNDLPAHSGQRHNLYLRQTPVSSQRLDTALTSCV